MNIVGRETERAFLADRLKELRDEPRAVIIRGESGLGKSTLVTSFAEEAATADTVVLLGACLNLDGGWPFQALKSGVDRWHRAHLEAPRRPRGSVGGPDARTTALMTQARELLGPAAGTRVGIPAVYEVLAALAAQHPVVWCLDDLQWVDTATRGLLVALMAAPPPCSILIVASATSTDLTAENATTRTLQRTLLELEASPRVARLTLAPLPLQDAMVLAERLGWAGDPAQTEQLCARAQGNPFHLTELVRHGPAPSDAAEAAEAGRSSMPEPLRHRLIERWNGQSPLGMDAVAAVAVSPSPVPHEVLVGALQEPEREVTAALRQAVGAGLLRSGDDGYIVAHRLLGEAVVADLLPGQRRSLHRRLAQQYAGEATLIGVPNADHRATRAHHWSRAGHPDRALPDLLAAAADADRSRPATTAWALWQAVLETSRTVSPDQVPSRLRWDAAAAAHRAGDSTAAVQLTDDLVTAQASGAQVVTRAQYLAAAGQVSVALEALDAVQRSEQQPAIRAAAVALSAELAVRQGSFRMARDRATILVSDPDEQPASAALSDSVLRAGVALGFSEAYLGNPAIGRHWLQSSLEQAEASGDVELAALAYHHLSELLAGPLNDLEEGVRIAQVGATRLAELGAPGPAVAALVASGVRGLFRLGRWQQAAEWVSTELTNNHVGHTLADLLLARARTVMALGQLQQADRDIDCAAILLADDSGEQRQLPLDTLRAGSALWRGQVDEARQAVRIGLAKVRPGYEDQWRLAPLIWHGLRAEGDAAARGLPVDLPWSIELRSALERAERSSVGDVQDTVMGYRLLCEAEMGRARGASDPTAWERAADHWQDRTHPYPATYARLHQAQALFAVRSRHQEGTTALRRAHQQAVRMAAGPLTREAEALALRARVRLAVAPTDQGGADSDGGKGSLSPAQEAGLSKREIEVLALVAQGRTNKEIGQVLFISERTVGVHVSKILTKLQVRSRVQASAWYVQVGSTADESPAVETSS